MGARWGSKNLVNISKRIGVDITDHGMKAHYLCGAMFEKPFYRHRLFETSFYWQMPAHPQHILSVRRGNMAYRNPAMGSGGQNPIKGDTDYHPNPVNTEWRKHHDGALNIRPGHAKGWHLAAEAMGIDWMKRDELTQAIPPVYTEFIGGVLLTVIRGRVRQ